MIVTDFPAFVHRHEYQRGWNRDDPPLVRVVVDGPSFSISFLVAADVAAAEYPLGSKFVLSLRQADA